MTNLMVTEFGSQFWYITRRQRDGCWGYPYSKLVQTQPLTTIVVSESWMLFQCWCGLCPQSNGYVKWKPWIVYRCEYDKLTSCPGSILPLAQCMWPWKGYAGIENGWLFGWMQHLVRWHCIPLHQVSLFLPDDPALIFWGPLHWDSNE